jgi:hypothetical protein
VGKDRLLIDVEQTVSSLPEKMLSATSLRCSMCWAESSGDSLNTPASEKKTGTYGYDRNFHE